MKLIDLLISENDVAPENVLFLRHSGKRVHELHDSQATLLEFTAVQDIGGRYDYWRDDRPDKGELLAVLAGDVLEAVYRVQGILREGALRSLATEEYIAFTSQFYDEDPEGKLNTPSRYFDLEAVGSRAIGSRVNGWRAPILTVLRSSSDLFHNIEVEDPRWSEKSGLGQSGTGAPSDALEYAVRRMTEAALQACAQSGMESVRTYKTKSFLFDNKAACQAHVRQLYAKQNGLCNLTGIPMTLGESGSQQGASLDRIDSTAHYSRDNLQLVCGFINRWKSDRPQEEFLQLLSMVRASSALV